MYTPPVLLCALGGLRQMLGVRLEYHKVCWGQWTAMVKLDVQIWRELIFSVMTLGILGAGMDPDINSSNIYYYYCSLTLDHFQRMEKR